MVAIIIGATVATDMEDSEATVNTVDTKAMADPVVMVDLVDPVNLVVIDLHTNITMRWANSDIARQ